MSPKEEREAGGVLLICLAVIVSGVILYQYGKNVEYTRQQSKVRYIECVQNKEASMQVCKDLYKRGFEIRGENDEV